MNLLDRLPPDQIVQLRDPHGEVLWEGLPADGRIRAVMPTNGVVYGAYLPDGTLLAILNSTVVGKGDSFAWWPRMTLSPRMLTICSIILTLVCVVWAKATYG